MEILVLFIIIGVIGSAGLMIFGILSGAKKTVSGISNNSKSKILKKTGLIEDVFNELFEDVEYNNPKDVGSILKNTDIRLKKNPFKKFYKIYGSDFVKGKYNGISFEIDDIELISKATKESGGEGISDHSDVKVFKGTFIFFDLKKELDSGVVLSEKFMMDNVNKELLKTNNNEFDNIYSIKASKEENLAKVLTPAVINSIIDNNKKLGTMYLQIKESGKIIGVIRSDKGFMNILDKKNEVNDREKLKKKLKEKLNALKDLMDAFRTL